MCSCNYTYVGPALLVLPLFVISLVNLFVAIRAAGFVGADDSTWFRLLVVLAWGATGTKPRVARLGPSGFWRKGGSQNLWIT